MTKSPSGVFMHNAVGLCSIQMAAPLGSCVGARRPMLVSLRLTSSSIAAQSLFIVLRELVRRPEGLAILVCLLQVRVWIGILSSAQTRIALRDM